MELLQNRKVFMKNKSTIWENKDGCADQYICATALYLLSMFSHVYNIVIDHGAGAPGHGKYVVDDFKNTDARFLKMFMTTVKLPGAATNYSHMVIHTTMSNIDISLVRVFQNNISDPTRAHGLIDRGKYRK